MENENLFEGLDIDNVDAYADKKPEAPKAPIAAAPAPTPNKSQLNKQELEDLYKKDPKAWWKAVPNDNKVINNPTKNPYREQHGLHQQGLLHQNIKPLENVSAEDMIKDYNEGGDKEFGGYSGLDWAGDENEDNFTKWLLLHNVNPDNYEKVINHLREYSPEDLNNIDDYHVFLDAIGNGEYEPDVLINALLNPNKYLGDENEKEVKTENGMKVLRTDKDKAAENAIAEREANWRKQREEEARNEALYRALMSGKVNK